jgi:hypothetical protein
MILQYAITLINVNNLMHEVTFFNMLPSITCLNKSKTKISLANQIRFPFIIIIKLHLTY